MQSDREKEPWFAGINTAIYSPSGANSGVGFAIPVDIVRSSVDQIIRFGRVIRPILGISFAPDQSSEQVRPSQLIPAAPAADIACAAGFSQLPV
jgi:S1-C subfamily serine protease